MNRSQNTPRSSDNHRQREREQRVRSALRQVGYILRPGWLVDTRRGKVYRHERIIATEQAHINGRKSE